MNPKPTDNLLRIGHWQRRGGSVTVPYSNGTSAVSTNGPGQGPAGMTEVVPVSYRGLAYLAAGGHGVKLAALSL
jgi:hypothetical protein